LSQARHYGDGDCALELTAWTAFYELLGEVMVDAMGTKVS